MDPGPIPTKQEGSSGGSRLVLSQPLPPLQVGQTFQSIFLRLLGLGMGRLSP